MRRRLLAGEDLRDILGMTTPGINERAQGFISQFVEEMIGKMRKGREVEAIHTATGRFIIAAEQFSGDDLSVVRKKIYEGRANAQGHLIERGSLRIRPNGDKLRSYCVLSEAADLMRADFESGQVTGRGDTIAECFGYAEMELLQRKVVEKVAGQRLEVVYGDTLKPTRRFSTPADSEIRDMQRQILGMLIPDRPTQ